MRIKTEINKHFKEFIKDNEKSVYFLLGGYGSSKSYNAALKLIIMSAMEKRKILVVRQVKENLRGSCFADLESSIETLFTIHFATINTHKNNFYFPLFSCIYNTLCYY